MKLQEIANAIGSDIPQQNADVEITGISSLHSAGQSEITFLSDDKFLQLARECSAAAVIVSREVSIEEKLCLKVDDPYLAYAKIAQIFEDKSPLFEGPVHDGAFVHSNARLDHPVFVGPGSVIGKDCTIGAGTVIGANCVIENGTTIGKDCRIDSGVVIRWKTEIGNRVIIQSNAVIGSDGFGNAMEGADFVRIPAFGIVIIEDDVDIGAGTTIDRGNFEPTIIGRGTKLDNLIHIAHNVEIGEKTAIAAQTGISGSTKVGKSVIIAGQAGFVGHITIGDQSFIGAKAGVSKSVEPGSKITGCPARDLMKMRRIEAAQLSLPDMVKEIKKLRKELDQIKKSTD
ncbi:MAG: UDP-3-O-(3-hydroxymyristoyl)glucosamine N-acyltransferase [Fibrobacterota bacterium]